MAVRRFAVICFILVSLTVWNARETLSMDLAQFQWKNRLLFIFSTDKNNPLFKNLKSEIINQQAEVKDRDLVVFEMLERGSAKMNGSDIDRQTADSIRDHFSVPSNKFSLILVGKDGSVKLKRHDHVSLEKVFELIDSMPMRQSEMRQKDQ
jgi:hypothetical protein